MIKRYPGKPVNYYREHALLSRLQGLPVPGVLPGSRPCELHLAYIDGLHGCEAISSGDAGTLLGEMGVFLRRLHQIDTRSVSDFLAGEGSVIVHGDFAHYNCLMSPDGTCLTAVLDWEYAHLGNKFEDLAWCEWQFRSAYPQHAWALSNLFEGYGEEPGHREREEIVTARIEELRSDMAQNAENRAPQKRPYYLVRFEQLDEGAAFVAALSRVLNSPQTCRPLPCETPEVWLRGGSLELCLNDQAVIAATGAFGRLRVNGLVFETLDKNGDRLLLGGECPPGWGFDEARAELRVA